MRTIVFIIFSILLVGFWSAKGQEISLSSARGETSLGIGVGLPYGALGLRIGNNIADHLNLFGGLGYQLVGIGYNVGLLKDFKSNGSAQFYLLGMYGSNSAIRIEGLEEENKLYAGFTIGLGVKINSNMKEGNYWDLGLLLPFRSSSFENDFDRLQNDPRISELSDPWPLLFTVGYNFNL